MGLMLILSSYPLPIRRHLSVCAPKMRIRSMVSRSCVRRSRRQPGSLNTRLKVTRRIISPDTKEAPLTGSANNAVYFTIGHSTRSLVDFLALLRDANVTFVVDVRTVPRSRTNPQYDRVTLAQELASQKIGYEHIAELGGLR